jgi:hypothetical protein
MIIMDLLIRCHKAESMNIYAYTYYTLFQMYQDQQIL